MYNYWQHAGADVSKKQIWRPIRKDSSLSNLREQEKSNRSHSAKIHPSLADFERSDSDQRVDRTASIPFFHPEAMSNKNMRHVM